MKKITVSIIFLCVYTLSSPSVANSQVLSQSSLQATVVTDQLSRPWSLALLPGGNYLVTERSGALRIVSKHGVVSAPIRGLPNISVIGQGGLLDAVLHPEFSANGFIYISYVVGDSKIGFSNEVMRATLVSLNPVGAAARPSKNLFEASLQYSLTGLKKIFTALPKIQGGRHFGGRLAFDKASYLFISLGDRGIRQHSQDLQTHHGSIIRLSDNGDIPKDNPFINNRLALPEIYSYGHRNVQGLAMHPTTGEIWSHEHGPQGGDEVNKLVSGKNYGWPVVSYGTEYVSGLQIGDSVKADGLEQPWYYWTPSIAPSGMAFFNDDMLVGSLKFKLLAVLSVNKKNSQMQAGPGTSLHKSFDEARLFKDSFGRIRDVRTQDSQTFYLLTDADRGKLIRVTKVAR
jgi:glucose/arabinose dehydrogenase